MVSIWRNFKNAQNYENIGNVVISIQNIALKEKRIALEMLRYVTRNGNGKEMTNLPLRNYWMVPFWDVGKLNKIVTT